MDENDISGWRSWLRDGEVALVTGDLDRSMMLLAAVRDELRDRAGGERLSTLPQPQRDEVVRLALRLLRAWRVAGRQAMQRN